MTEIEKRSNGDDSYGKGIFAEGNRCDSEKPEGVCPEICRLMRDVKNHSRGACKGSRHFQGRLFYPTKEMLFFELLEDLYSEIYEACADVLMRNQGKPAYQSIQRLWKLWYMEPSSACSRNN